MAFVRCIFLIFLFTLSSCQFFDTEKVSSDAILEEEMKSINWKDIDAYPLFENCKESLDKLEQRNCFTNTLNYVIINAISEEDLVSVRDLRDTLKIHFSVEKTGRILIAGIEIDSVFNQEFPNVEKRIRLAMDSVQPISPAYKRGIPVETEFFLPVVIHTD